jgi:hypothetical protein
MRLKTNLVISLVFIALLGFVYIYEVKGGEDRQIAAERARQLLDFSTHEAQRVTIDRGDTVLVLERQGDAWRLTSPVHTDADAAAVERYLGAMGEIELEGDPLRDGAAVVADPTILTEYGLDNPRLRVHLDLLEDGVPLDTLRFGDDTPTDRFTYVQRSGGTTSPEVVRVRAWRFDNLNKTTFDLRDRSVLAFEASEVQRVRLQRAGEPAIEASRSPASGWQLDAPVARRADASLLNGMLKILQDAKTEEIVFEDPSPADLETIGLAGAGDVATELTLWIGDDRAEKRLLLGVAGDDGSQHARDTSRRHVFLADSTVVSQLRTPVDDLRNKRVLTVSSDSVATLSFEEGGVLLWSAQRDTGGTWHLTEPVGREAKGWRFSGLLTDLDGLEATRFAADGDAAGPAWDERLAVYGLDTPQWEIVVTRSDGSQARLQIGDRREGEAFVVGDEVLSVSVVDDDVVEGLYLGLDDVSTPPAQELDADADTAAVP